jgi:HTH-type transcriptional regulator, sugar sensing transcriptional regulator
MDTKILEKIGLSKNEIKVFIELLKQGVSTTGPIIDNTGIANSRVYHALNSLIKKGFVTFFTKNNVKYFKAEDPELITKDLETKKEKVEKLIPQLKSLRIKDKKEEYTTIYEGFKGFRSAFEKLIEVCSHKDEVFVLGFSQQPYAFKSLRIFLKNIDLKRYKKKINLKIILDLNMKKTIGKDREEEPYTEVKYMEKGYFSPAGMNIFKDYVMLLLWEEKPFVFMIKNQKIAESFKQYFELLWKISEKK